MTDTLSHGGARELISFRIGSQEFCVDIMAVREIRGWTQATQLPQSPAFVRGVINLRGAIVPIVDLGLMFGFPEPIALEDASAIVLNVNERLVGLVVSSVSDVLALADEEILPAPEIAAKRIAGAISGIGARQDGDARASVLLLDVAHIMKRIREERE